MTSPSPASSDLVEHISAHIGSLPSPNRFEPYFSNSSCCRGLRFATAGAVGAFVHLAARAEIADLGILRRSERTGIKTVAAADAQILGMQRDAVFGRKD